MNLRQPVIIVGAGPVGMTAALSLAKGGVPSIVIDLKATLCTSGSRAIVVDQASLSHFRDIGCVEEILATGLVPLCRRTFFQGKEIFTNPFPRPSQGGLPRFINLPQCETERILFDHASKQPLIRTLLNHKVVSLTQNGLGATLVVEHGGKTFELSSQFIIACDGCRSPMRNLCGMDFPGITNPFQFLIVDVEAKLDREHEHHFHFNHPQNPGHSVLVVPQPKNVWRIDWQIPMGTEPDCSEGAIQNRVEAVIGKQPCKIVWQSTYRFHQRLVPSMSSGCVHFAGDAAHLVNPFGARGMNSGIQDVRFLTHLLVRIYRGEHPSIIGEYAKVRGEVNRKHQAVTTKTMRFIAPGSRIGTFVRNGVLHLSNKIPVARKMVNSGKMSDERPSAFLQ